MMDSAGRTTPSGNMISAVEISSSAAFRIISETPSLNLILTSASPSKVNSSRSGLKDRMYFSGRTVVGSLADVSSVIFHSPPSPARTGT